MEQSRKIHRVPDELWIELKVRAARAGKTISEWIITALREAVEKK